MRIVENLMGLGVNAVECKAMSFKMKRFIESSESFIQDALNSGEVTQEQLDLLASDSEQRLLNERVSKAYKKEGETGYLALTEDLSEAQRLDLLARTLEEMKEIRGRL